MASQALDWLGGRVLEPLADQRLWLGLALVICAAIAGIELLAWLRSWRLRWRFWRARRLEASARCLLEARGYEVLAEQLSRAGRVEVGGEQKSYQVRADYLARAGTGLLYVVEVKSGQRAPDPLHTATRRQLLEYQLVYAETSGVLLVDMASRALIPIRFAIPEPLVSDRAEASQ